MREWNPLWHDLEDNANAAYLAAIRRLVVAGINWIEDHPGFKPNIRERNKRAMMRAAGIPDDVPESEVNVAAAWEDVFQPANSHTRQWLRAMDAAARNGDPRGAPSAHMMSKGIGCGILLVGDGWDAFNAFMLSPGTDTAPDA